MVYSPIPPPFSALTCIQVVTGIASQTFQTRTPLRPIDFKEVKPEDLLFL